MNDYLEEQLDVTKGRLVEIEKSLAIMHENVLTVADQLKETQKFLVKLAHNQSEISKRVTLWPYIPIPEKDEDY